MQIYGRIGDEKLTTVFHGTVVSRSDERLFYETVSLRHVVYTYKHNDPMQSDPDAIMYRPI